MEKTDKKIIEEIIRVNHAGEMSQIKIFEGQLLALKTIKQDETLKDLIEEMKEQEKVHLEYFKQQLQKRKVKPTYLLPLWDVMSVALGFGSALLGKKATLLTTAAIEEEISDHYKSQLLKLRNDEKDLKKKIEQFKEDEASHKNMAYEAAGATNKGLYSIIDKVIKTVIKTGSRIAITISEKI
jgi:ubiquinone biosynthesis monooxygenase Coq7